MKKNNWRYRNHETATFEFKENIYISLGGRWQNKLKGYEWQQGLWWKRTDK